MPSEKGLLPKHWTPNITYLTAPAYSPSLTQAHTSTLKTRPKDAQDIPSDTPRGPSPLVKITPITTPSHPACGQSGLFAAKDLKPGTFILQYIGEVHAPPSTKTSTSSSSSSSTSSSHPSSLSSSSPSSPPPAAVTAVATTQTPKPDGDPNPIPIPDPHATSDYDLSLDRYHGIGIDAATRGNEARFINDYRGVADAANAEFREVWDARRGERGMGVWVLPEGRSAKAKAKGSAKGIGKGNGYGKGKGKGKGIRKGEEILVSYGRGFWGARRGQEA